MRAARFHTAHDIRIEDVPEPTITAPDELLLEVALCGICGTDLHEYTSGPIVTPVDPHPLTGATLPQILGHEFSARVVEVGPAVRGARVGDRVSVMPAIVCGHCWACRHGKANLCSNFAATGLSAATGGLALVGGGEGLPGRRPPRRAVRRGRGAGRAGRGGRVRPGTGAGRGRRHRADHRRRTGRGAERALRRCGGRRAWSSSSNRTRSGPPGRGRWTSGRCWTRRTTSTTAIAELTGGVGVDVVAECSGTTAGLGLAVRATRPAGRIVQTGLHTRPATLDAMLLAAEGPRPLRQLVLPHHRLAPHHPDDRPGQLPGAQGPHLRRRSRRRGDPGLRRPRRPGR